MIDVNAEAEKTLSALDYRITYFYPEQFNELPIISFYNLTEHPDFTSDNQEDIQSGTVVVDIWADEPSDCGSISLQINKIMTTDGWEREFSRDLPQTDGVYHRTMRYTKLFILGGI